MNLTTQIIDSVEGMKKATGFSGPFAITSHPTMKKRILREHVAQALDEAGIEVKFFYGQWVPEEQVILQKMVDELECVTDD